MAYIVQNGSIVAKVEGAFTPVKGSIRFSSQRAEERIDAAREWNLVSASTGRLVEGSTWDAKWSKTPCGADRYAEQLVDGEFYVR